MKLLTMLPATKKVAKAAPPVMPVCGVHGLERQGLVRRERQQPDGRGGDEGRRGEAGADGQ